MTWKPVFLTSDKEKAVQDIYWIMVKIVLPFQYIDKEVYRG